MSKTTVSWLIFATVLFLSLAVLWSLELQINEVESKHINVTLIITTDEWSIEYNASTLNNTVFKILKECAEFCNFSIEYEYYESLDAYFITSINGTENGDGLYWQYYVNGVYGEIASDKKEIFDGDRIEWRFEESHF